MGNVCLGPFNYKLICMLDYLFCILNYFVCMCRQVFIFIYNSLRFRKQTLCLLSFFLWRVGCIFDFSCIHLNTYRPLKCFVCAFFHLAQIFCMFPCTG